MKKFVIVGLGNIGAEYKNTRHNIGFNIVEALADQYNGEWETSKNSYKCTIKIKGRTVVLVKPTTYMNLSGKAVKHHVTSEKIPLNQLMVVTDDLSLDYGTIRVRGKGSAGGHNGHKNIIATLNTDQYPRLRFGISATFSKGKQVDYVLGKWSADELFDLDDLIAHSVKAIEAFVFLGIGECMTKFNKKAKSE